MSPSSMSALVEKMVSFSKHGSLFIGRLLNMGRFQTCWDSREETGGKWRRVEEDGN